MADKIFTVCTICEYEFDVENISGECPNCGLEYIVTNGEVKWRYNPEKNENHLSTLLKN